MLTIRPPSYTSDQYPPQVAPFFGGAWPDRGEKTYNDTGLVSRYNEASGSCGHDFGLVDGNDGKFHTDVDIYETR